MRIYYGPKRRQRVCIEDRVSTPSIKPTFLARLWTLFRGATYRVVISHRGPIDKLTILLNDAEIGSVVTHDD